MFIFRAKGVFSIQLSGEMLILTAPSSVLLRFAQKIQLFHIV